jgi:hypothetical protein
MSRVGDLLIGMQEDAECVIDSCQTLEKFVEEMCKLNTLYTPTLLEEFWDGYVHSQEEYTYVLLIANRQSFGLYKQ